MALLPALYADCNDWIAIDSDCPDALIKDSEYYQEATRKNLRIIRIDMLAESMRIASSKQFEIKPWGWNHTLRRRLVAAGVDESMLKSEEEIDRLRDLSHRRTGIKVQHFLQSLITDFTVPVAIEAFSVEDVMEFVTQNPDAFLKLPWSSSGRGVIRAADFPVIKLREWAGGGIKRQGSVMCEKGFHRNLDFASEWLCRNGDVVFLGLSIFRTSDDGRYLGNIIAPQQELNAILKEQVPIWSERIIKAQRLALKEIVAPYYDGPVGIDMLSATDGSLHPCVELNLRQTMGAACIIKN